MIEIESDPPVELVVKVAGPEPVSGISADKLEVKSETVV